MIDPFIEAYARYFNWPCFERFAAIRQTALTILCRQEAGLSADILSGIAKIVVTLDECPAYNYIE